MKPIYVALVRRQRCFIHVRRVYSFGLKEGTMPTEALHVSTNVDEVDVTTSYA